MNTGPSFATVDLLLSKYAAQEHISREMLTMTVDQDDLMDMVVFRLVRSVATVQGKERIEVPEGWLDAWLLENMHRRRAPVTRWLVWQIVKRRPVRHKVYRVDMYLPDVPLPRRGEYLVRVASFERDWAAE